MQQQQQQQEKEEDHREASIDEAFYQGWHRTHKIHIEKLHDALQSRNRGFSDSEFESGGEDGLLALIRRSLDDYRDYYDAKRRAVGRDAFQVLSPLWQSALESAFMWMGGWRPTSAFQVALSQIQSPPDSPAVLSGLTPQQLASVEAEKARSRAAEEEISRKAALLQKSIADRSVVRIAQGVEFIDATLAFEQLRGVMRDKVEQLCDLVLQADALRLASLEAMVDILSPVQAAQFLVTAEVLKLAFSHVGEIKDRKAAAAAEC